MARDIEYKVPAAKIADWQKAYDSGRRALDILKKLRISGMPNAEAEARVEAGIEKVQRLADSFNVDLEE